MPRRPWWPSVEGSGWRAVVVAPMPEVYAIINDADLVLVSRIADVLELHRLRPQRQASWRSATARAGPRRPPPVAPHMSSQTGSSRLSMAVLSTARGDQVHASSAHHSISGVLCPMRARGHDGGHRLAAKLPVTRPTRGGATGPSQGGSAGFEPVGATTEGHHNTASDLEE